MVDKKDERKKSPSFFKFAYLAGGFTQLSGSLSVSVNTLLVALGATPFQIGIVSSVNLIGKIFSQLFALSFLNLFSSRRRTLMLALSIELLFKLGLAFLAFSQPSYWFIIAVIILFSLGILNHTSFLSYFTWMGEIVPKDLKDRFFSNRSITGEIFLIIGSCVAAKVLSLDTKILFLLGCLCLAAYIARNMEVLIYLFHPDIIREKITQNHIVRRIRAPFRDKNFVSFSVWYNFIKTASILNILFLEFFIVKVLNLSFFSIPLYFIVMSAGNILGLRLCSILFPRIALLRKMYLVSFILVASSFFWLFAQSFSFLLIALVLAGIVDASIHLSQRVEVINYAEGDNKDKEAYYAAFNTLEYAVTSVAVFVLGFIQKEIFNFKLIFFITIGLSIISFFFIHRVIVLKKVEV